MKDILIKGTKIKKEIFYWLGSFLAAIVINIFAIIKYKTNWIELLTQIHVVIVVSILIYLLLLMFRVIYTVIRKLYNKNSTI